MLKYVSFFALTFFIAVSAQAQTPSQPQPQAQIQIQAQPQVQPQLQLQAQPQAPAPAQPQAQLQLSPEVLDDSNIQKVFDQSLAIVTDGQAMHDFLENRYDDSFSAKITTTTSINNNAPKTESLTFNKKDAIEDVANMYAHGKVEDFQGSIIKIEYSKDHKYAFVSNTAKATYALNINLSDGKSAVAHLLQAQGCVELLTLVGTTIKYLKSDCNINQSLRP